MTKKRISYAGKEVFLGMDVHKSFYVVSAVCDGELVKLCRLPARANEVINFIKKYFPGATVRSCYEAGFSGFGLHRVLEGAGIENLVVHAAAVEVSSRDRVKTDKRDSTKLAIQLAGGRLKGIRIPSEREERSRLLSRTREQLCRSISRARIQIRMKLHQFDLMDSNENRVLSRRMVRETLDNGACPEVRMSVEVLLLSWESMLVQKRKLEKEFRRRSEKDPIYLTWLSLPGIGPVSSRILGDELGDMSQFSNERCLFSFTGLTPGEYSSGEKVHRGHISRQGSARLRHTLVEAAWRAIRIDTSLKEDFERIAARRGKKRAIVAIARKLVGRARAVFRTQEVYQLGYSKAA